MAKMIDEDAKALKELEGFLMKAVELEGDVGMELLALISPLNHSMSQWSGGDLSGDSLPTMEKRHECISKSGLSTFSKKLLDRARGGATPKESDLIGMLDHMDAFWSMVLEKVEGFGEHGIPLPDPIDPEIGAMKNLYVFAVKMERPSWIMPFSASEWRADLCSSRIYRFLDLYWRALKIYTPQRNATQIDRVNELVKSEEFLSLEKHALHLLEERTSSEHISLEDTKCFYINARELTAKLATIDYLPS
ncbi:MAG: hypothetical protein EOP09_16335 [Proteobacteria bacterium]|nr:MAG: hypothetical protein EOP09_16335 [Pseudomonadota bacterium]